MTKDCPAFREKFPLPLSLEKGKGRRDISRFTYSHEYVSAWTSARQSLFLITGVTGGEDFSTQNDDDNKIMPRTGDAGEERNRFFRRFFPSRIGICASNHEK